MAALTAADFSVAIVDQVIMKKKRLVFGTLTLTNTSGTYPTAGIPLPALANFGMVRQLDSLMLFGINALTSDYLVRYNKSAHKLMLYVSHDTAGATAVAMDEAGTGLAPATRTYDFMAIGW